MKRRSDRLFQRVDKWRGCDDAWPTCSHHVSDTVNCHQSPMSTYNTIRETVEHILIGALSYSLNLHLLVSMMLFTLLKLNY